MSHSARSRQTGRDRTTIRRVQEGWDFALSGDKVWARLRGKGTHGGEILGGPTGRAFEIAVIDACRFRDGKIVEHWGVADRFAQMQQLGIFAGAPQPAASP